MPRIRRPIADLLPTMPVDLTCPYCEAMPSQNCTTSYGGRSAVHVPRIKAAIQLDKTRRVKKLWWTPGIV
jgi:hypothetical protein